ncbi:hypothetical protein [uncultured Bifidobacterium sp.]|uniref:hypothetical protein n=1 Tax=uncultured Bifidobacterium sp. TaxID=165187 RepID=UPI002607C411|nr:hypothetical protein [uncultured Bifidobacterium sp.]
MTATGRNAQAYLFGGRAVSLFLFLMAASTGVGSSCAILKPIVQDRPVSSGNALQVSSHAGTNRENQILPIRADALPSNLATSSSNGVARRKRKMAVVRPAHISSIHRMHGMSMTGWGIVHNLPMIPDMIHQITSICLCARH